MKGMITWHGPQDFDKVAKLRGATRGLNVTDDGDLIITRTIPPPFLHLGEFLLWHTTPESRPLCVRKGDVITIYTDGRAVITSRRGKA